MMNGPPKIGPPGIGGAPNLLNKLGGPGVGLAKPPVKTLQKSKTKPLFWEVYPANIINNSIWVKC